ncbi:MAG: AAA family ATPase [Planktothrix sp.]
MLKISGYRNLSAIYESDNSIVYRGLKESENQPVIIKVLKGEYPSLEQIARYKLEYEINQKLFQVEGVVKSYHLENYQNHWLIISEDFGGENLKAVSEELSRNLKLFLSIAIQVTQTLGKIHQANIIHKDLNPFNLVYNRETEQAKIIDFGISTLFSRENPTFKNPNVIEGTLAYMSPEQTGRMNRALDYRTDFYSLGVTFYELLTQQLPFPTQDALELVYCHIAKQPVSPREINPEIPEVVSALVMKLLAKTAEDRYQSAWGLASDLQNCLNQLEEMGRIQTFTLGENDSSSRFQISQKLYGREAEIELLLQASNRLNDPALNGGKEMMLISGYSGIGKSALVREIYKPLTQKHGYFISGKFDQLQRNIPYGAIAQAFATLIRQLLTETPEQIEQWRSQLVEALGVNAQIMVDLIGELELIIGTQPPVSPLPPGESQNRFNLVFQNFINVFTQKEHPLIIFLDDLQWADAASLKIIHQLMTRTDSQYFLLIGCYRDNEVSATDPLMLTVSEIRECGALVNKISLTPLGLSDISQLIADALKTETPEILPLAELVLQKTNGNPFFITEFLEKLYADHLLSFEVNLRRWQWDINEIQSAKITDNVVELMVLKIQSLPEAAQKFIKLAACIGNQFNLLTLSLLDETPAQTIAHHLFDAVELGLIFTRSEESNWIDAGTEVSHLSNCYSFVHDRIQQAAYTLLDPESQRAIHLKIGRGLLKNTPEGERGANLFEIIDHLNIGQGLITEPEERIKLAQLNLSAGKKAQESTAYAAAWEYLQFGVSYLPEACWTEYYDLSLALHKQWAEVEYLKGNFEAAEELITLVLARSHTDLEKAKIYNLAIVQYTLQFKYAEGIAGGRKALQLLGIDLPQSDFQSALMLEIGTIEKELGDQEIASLIHHPQMTDPEQIIAIQLLVNLLAVSYIINLELYSIIVAKIVQTSLKYGHSRESAQGYSTYGFLMCCFGNYLLGYEFGSLAAELSEQCNYPALKCKNYTVVGGLIYPWVKPLKASDSLLSEGYKAGWLSGEFQYIGYILQFQAIRLFCRGTHLPDAWTELSNFLAVTQETQNQWATDNILGFKIGLANLLGNTTDELTFEVEEISESAYLSNSQEHQSWQGICYYKIVKFAILYLYGAFAEALNLVPDIAQLIPTITGNIIVADYNFYHSLTLAALYPTASSSDSALYLQQLEANQTQMKIWAENCPETFHHKFLLVAAEIARILGQDLEAMELYDRAITQASEQDFIHHEAIAHELAGKFWWNKGKEDFAAVYLKKSHYKYQLWGATRKVEKLVQQYPTILGQRSRKASGELQTTVTLTTTDSHRGEVLDFATIMKASQAIASEIHLDKLLTQLIKITLENAGAQQGFLILSNHQQLMIEGSGTMDTEIQVLQSMPVHQSPQLPQSIIQYVARTQQSVVLSDATTSEMFATDAYIIEQQPKSVLCSPIVNRGTLVGILYLENNLTPEAFTPDRLELLNVVSAQAAISIENAQLYQNLEIKVEERTAQLAEANQEITLLNERLKAENLRMSAELDVTRKLQKMVLPKERELQQIPDLEIAGFMEPADEVGGDYYDVLPHAGGVKFAIGDVTGHGLESGMLMIMAQMAVRTLLESEENDPIRFLEIINRAIYKNVERMNVDKNMTLAILDYHQGDLKISGQHEEAIIVRKGGEIERIDTLDLGLYVGLEPDIGEFLNHTEFQLNPGDGVVLYTDGITEAEDINGVQYGLERLCEVVSASWNLSAYQMRERVIDELMGYIGTQKVYDDITLLVIKQK